MGIWDDAPTPQSVDLTSLPEEERKALLADYLDEAKAVELVTQIDGSAADYEASMERIAQVIGYINVAMGGALRVAKAAT